MISYRNILCPTDFSEASNAALTHAEDLARRLDANLVLAHVVEPLMAPIEYGVPSAALVGYGDAARARARIHLETAAHALRTRGVRTRVIVTAGAAAGQICDLARQEQADLVVLGTHGYTGLKHALLGSTAERVVRTCPCPVLTVRSTGQTASVTARPARSEADSRSASSAP